MKNLFLFLFLSVSTFFFTNCEKNVTKTVNELEESGERISFLKTSSYSSEDNSQDPFQMLYAEVKNDTTINFIMEYKIGEEYKLHQFDFVWNGKFEDDADGKKWMNIEIYHKTKEENQLQSVSDSAYVSIPDLSRIKEEDIDKIWLKLINSTDDSNTIILKYKGNTSEGDDNSGSEGDGEGEGEDDGNDDTPVDSTSVSSIANLSN